MANSKTKSKSSNGKADPNIKSTVVYDKLNHYLVPWKNSFEWLKVYSLLCSSEASDWNQGLSSILVWSTLNYGVPLYVDATISVVQARIALAQYKEKIDSDAKSFGDTTTRNDLNFNSSDKNYNSNDQIFNSNDCNSNSNDQNSNSNDCNSNCNDYNSNNNDCNSNSKDQNSNSKDQNSNSKDQNSNSKDKNSNSKDQNFNSKDQNSNSNDCNSNSNEYNSNPINDGNSNRNNSNSDENNRNGNICNMNKDCGDWCAIQYLKDSKCDCDCESDDNEDDAVYRDYDSAEVAYNWDVLVSVVNEAIMSFSNLLLKVKEHERGVVGNSIPLRELARDGDIPIQLVQHRNMLVHSTDSARHTLTDANITAVRQMWQYLRFKYWDTEMLMQQNFDKEAPRSKNGTCNFDVDIKNNMLTKINEMLMAQEQDPRVASKRKICYKYQNLTRPKTSTNKQRMNHGLGVAPYEMPFQDLVVPQNSLLLPHVDDIPFTAKGFDNVPFSDYGVDGIPFSTKGPFGAEGHDDILFSADVKNFVHGNKKFTDIVDAETCSDIVDAETCSDIVDGEKCTGVVDCKKIIGIADDSKKNCKKIEQQTINSPDFDAPLNKFFASSASPLVKCEGLSVVSKDLIDTFSNFSEHLASVQTNACMKGKNMTARNIKVSDSYRKERNIVVRSSKSSNILFDNSNSTKNIKGGKKRKCLSVEHSKDNLNMANELKPENKKRKYLSSSEKNRAKTQRMALARSLKR